MVQKYIETWFLAVVGYSLLAGSPECLRGIRDDNEPHVLCTSPSPKGPSRVYLGEKAGGVACDV